MRFVYGSRSLAAMLVLLLVLISGASDSGSLVLAQDGTPATENQQAEEPPVEQPAETAVPELPTEVPSPTEIATQEPTVPIEIQATEDSVQAAADITLYPNPEDCSPGLNFWQIFVTMDDWNFPSEATLTFSDGGTATVPYQASSYIEGRYYGYFQWYDNLSDEFVSITGGFPEEQNPAVETVSGPRCGPPTVTPTATDTATNTATATFTATATPTAANITLTQGSASCYEGLGFWQIFVTMDGYQFPATAILNFDNGDSEAVPYQQSSYDQGRYYGFFEWYGNETDQFVSITGAFPAELNPLVDSVSGPNCGPSEPATATATPTIPAPTTLAANFSVCTFDASAWQVAFKSAQNSFPSTLTLNFAGGATGTGSYSGISFGGGAWTGTYVSGDQLSGTLESISVLLPSGMTATSNAIVQTGPSCPGGDATTTPTATTTASNTPVNTVTATESPTVTNTTLVPDPSVCSSGLGFWRIFVTMDGTAFPATATMTFDSGETGTSTYNQSSFISGRYYAFYDWYSNLDDQFVSISGGFPAELNPIVESVSGPNCGPSETATAVPSNTPVNTETATATATATVEPTVANITLYPDPSVCTAGLGFWQIFVTMDDYEFPATATLNFSSGSGTASYIQSSFINNRAYGLYEWYANTADEFLSISGAFPQALNPAVQSVSGPNCGPVETATATTTTEASNTPVNTETATATSTSTETHHPHID